MDTAKESRKTRLVTLHIAPEALARTAVEYGPPSEGFDHTPSIKPTSESNKDLRTKSLAHQSSVSAASTATPSRQESPIMSLPPELRVDIAERFLSQHASWCLEKSQSGEPLLAIWNRVSAEDKLHKYDRHTQRMISSISCPSGIDIVSVERYIYRPGVPALLQINRTLRKESVYFYLESARVQIARYEAEHELALQKYAKLLWTFDAVESGFVDPYRGPDTLSIVGEEIYELVFEMIERFLRWHVLRESCILVRSGPEPV